MTRAAGLIDRSLAEFARAVAAPGPVPGSGSVAAALGAFGAGLASMALGAGRGEGVAIEGSAGAARRMEALLARVDLDAEAYAGFLEARAGRGELTAAIERSIAVPCEIAAEALAALEGLVAACAAVRPRLRSEAVTAAHALRAAVEGATFTAGANLPGLADARERERRGVELQALRARAEGLLVAFQDRLRDALGGDSG